MTEESDLPTPDSLANQRRRLLMEMDAASYIQWRHHPITAAVLQFLDDQIGAWRELAADIVENGWFDPTAKEEGLNPNVVRGKIAAARELRDLQLAAIQGFYSQGSTEDTAGEAQHSDEE